MHTIHVFQFGIKFLEAKYRYMCSTHTVVQVINPERETGTKSEAKRNE
jgi:hypothetical protein